MSRRRTMTLAASTLLALPALAACGTSALDLSVGDCLSSADLESDEISTVTTLECSEPHDAEIYAVLQHSQSTFPGESAIADEANTFCLEQFEGFVGTSYDVSNLVAGPITPTRDSWNNADDRESLCVVLSMEDVTSSLRDSKL